MIKGLTSDTNSSYGYVDEPLSETYGGPDFVFIVKSIPVTIGSTTVLRALWAVL